MHRACGLGEIEHNGTRWRGARHWRLHALDGPVLRLGDGFCDLLGGRGVRRLQRQGFGRDHHDEPQGRVRRRDGRQARRPQRARHLPAHRGEPRVLGQRRQPDRLGRAVRELRVRRRRADVPGRVLARPREERRDHQDPGRRSRRRRHAGQGQDRQDQDRPRGSQRGRARHHPRRRRGGARGHRALRSGRQRGPRQGGLREALRAGPLVLRGPELVQQQRGLVRLPHHVQGTDHVVPREGLHPLRRRERAALPLRPHLRRRGRPHATEGVRALRDGVLPREPQGRQRGRRDAHEHRPLGRRRDWRGLRSVAARAAPRAAATRA